MLKAYKVAAENKTFHRIADRLSKQHINRHKFQFGLTMLSWSNKQACMTNSKYPHLHSDLDNKKCKARNEKTDNIITNYIYHLEILASRSTLNKIRASTDIINGWPFNPWNYKVSPFRVYLEAWKLRLDVKLGKWSFRHFKGMQYSLRY